MKIFFPLLFLIALSCNNTAQNLSDTELNKIVNAANIKYAQTKDKKNLLEAYDKLKNNKEFNDNGLSGNNSLPIISLLMNLKKYNELDRLLTQNKTINSYNRKNTLNLVRYLNNYNKDRNKSKSFIYDNIKRINDSILKSPKDSLLYADYFSMRMFLKGKIAALREIDSMQSVNKKYSEIFYKSILKESIEVYPDEDLPIK